MTINPLTIKEIEERKHELLIGNFSFHDGAFLFLLSEVKRLQEALTIKTLENAKGTQVLSNVEDEVKRLRDKISQHKIETWKRGDHPIIDADLTLWKEGK